MLHDIGKVGIPEVILNKAGSLDAREWETMTTHTELGAKILQPLHGMSRIQEMIRHHHEFFDGTGYPDQLEGESIPYGARVIAIADSYDTITSERTYKKPRTPDDALREIERCAGSQFDPEIVRVFIETMRRSPHPVAEPAAVPDRAGSPTI
jgi:HD-GYP domain-containing protein (c-di-GMP phosphodiesterase class II)